MPDTRAAIRGVIRAVTGNAVNFVFVGEAGGGKSEIALNFAAALRALGEKEVHFFDLDMTKPLFRSRDMEAALLAEGIVVHYQEQFMDAPTTVGGVRVQMNNANSFTVIDVGGDYIGARAIGGFNQELNRADTMVYYVLNAFRPWSYDIDHIDETLAKILGVSHIKLESLHFVNNSNCGPQTTAEEFLEGAKQLEESLAPYAKLSFSTVRREIYHQVKDDKRLVLPLELYMGYPWQEEAKPSFIGIFYISN